MKPRTSLWRKIWDAETPESFIFYCIVMVLILAAAVAYFVWAEAT